MEFIMLNDLERKEIADMMKKYRSVQNRLSRNYLSRNARDLRETIANRAWVYLAKMRENMNKITSDDVKYFAILIDKFDEMRREKLFKELQLRAEFDVAGFVDSYNRGKIKDINQSKKSGVKELSAKKLNKLSKKYRVICDDLSRGDKDITHKQSVADKYKTRAYDYARAIVDGVIVVKPENIKSARSYLKTVCYPIVDGDVAYRALNLLDSNVDVIDEKDEIVNDEKPLVAEKVKSVAHGFFARVSGAFKSVKSKVDEKRADIEREIQERKNAAAERAREEKRIRDEKERETQEAALEKQRLMRVVHARNVAEKNVKRKDDADARKINRRENFEQAKALLGKTATSVIDNVGYGLGAIVDGAKEKYNSVKAKHEIEKQNHEIIRDAERASREHWKNLEQQQPKNQKLEQLQNSMQAVSEKYENTVADVAMKVSGAIDKGLYNVGSVVSEIMVKHDDLKAKRKTAKQNREIIRDAERASREHWKELKREEKQNKEPNKNRNLFVRVAVGTAVAAVLFGGIMLLQNNKHNKVEKEPVKKEVKAPVAHEKVAEPVSVDTAYMAAMNNYCNSAMDIIAGAKKKNDVITKLNNQVENGNLVLNDSISIERVAYTYFIYREYGFNIDVLNLAVNGNQKLTDAQMAELNKVIVDAGERGKGVQQMAKQRVEARGGSLGKHSKFENATKAQQRAYLVNRGVLKKAHTR